MVRGQPGQIVLEILTQKNPSQKRAGGVAQVVEECLPSKHETLSSTSSSDKTNKQIEKIKTRKKSTICDHLQEPGRHLAK
jgi:hypothetical protein